MDGIDVIAKRGISLITHEPTRSALEAAYRTHQAASAVRIAERVFDRLTSARFPKESTCRFLAGWHATHGTSQFVSGLMIRMLREAERRPEADRPLLHRAVGMIAEIIPEDTGVDDTPHAELFARFATFLAGDDAWRLDRYIVPACERFRAYVQDQRLRGSIEEAILTTAASENWNSGEYTYLDGLVGPWMTRIIGADDSYQYAVRYVSVHAGDTELGHFMHAMRAWEAFCHASGVTIDPEKARHVFVQYLTRLTDAFAALDEALAEGRAT